MSVKIKLPARLADLSEERQKELLAFMRQEFNCSNVEALQTLNASTTREFRLHLDACENGYI